MPLYSRDDHTKLSQPKIKKLHSQDRKRGKGRLHGKPWADPLSKKLGNTNSVEPNTDFGNHALRRIQNRIWAKYLINTFDEI